MGKARATMKVMAPTDSAAARRPRPRPSQTGRSPRRWLMIAAPAIAILAVMGGVIGVHLTTANDEAGRPDISDLNYVANARAEFAGIPSTGNTVGYAKAPVTITEFGDLRCPVCREFDSAVIPQVLQRLVRTHKAKLVYRHWPILGENSVYADRAAYAAMKQNRLWEYALVTYYNQGDEQLNWFSKAFARAVAMSIGLNLDTFDSDFDDTSASAAEIASVTRTADHYQFNGTPSVLVGNARTTRNLGDAVPTYEDIARAVKDLSPAGAQ
jgi:protein-disulfide isomerase